MEIYNIAEVIKKRFDQKSFHVASEKNVRVEFHNMKRNDCFGPLKFSGDAIITCYQGVFHFGEKGEEITESMQVIISCGEAINFQCRSDFGTVQIIWCPAFAQTEF